MHAATALILKWSEQRGKSPNTSKAYATDVRMFFEEMNLAEFSLADLEDLASSWMNRRRRQVAPKTLARRVTSMRVLGKCLGVEILAEYSLPTPARAMPHPLPNLVQDLERMMAGARNDEQRALVALMGLEGLRVSEAREVGPQDFDLHHMTLTVRGKGDKTRVLPVSRTAWQILCPSVLQAQIEDRPTLIRFTDRHARETITRLGARAGISRPVSSHDLRATFATVAYHNSGNDIRAVQELLGHASVLQTQLYVGTTQKEMRRAADFEFNFDADEDD